MENGGKGFQDAHASNQAWRDPQAFIALASMMS